MQMQGANLRQWLKWPECPEVIWQFKHLFDKAFSSNKHQNEDSASTTRRPDVAHLKHDGIIVSHCSTHLGNSLVLYYPSSSSSTPIAGSIQVIDTSGDQIYLSIKCQSPLPPGNYDPFRRYSSFPATIYSSNMDDGPADRVPLESVVSHVARFTFSSGCAVILNLSRVRPNTFIDFVCLNLL
jgi:hypothetical protein